MNSPQTTAIDESLLQEDDYNENPKEKNSLYFLKLILSFAVGFAFASFNYVEAFSPFSPAFAVAVPYQYCFTVFLGSCLGYFLNFSWQSALRYTLATVAIILFRLAAYKGIRKLSKNLFGSIMCFAALLSSGIVYYYLMDTTPMFIFKLSAECVLSSAMTCFFKNGFNSRILKSGFSSLDTKDLFSLIISLCSLLMCVCSITLEGISPGRIIACLILMFISLYKGISFSAIAGILIGSCLCLSPSGAYLFSAFTFAGLISGAFSSSGQIAVSLSFALSFLSAAFFSADISEMWLGLIEPCIACGTFLIIPASKINSIQDAIEAAGFIKENHISHEVAENLKTASQNIYQAAEIVTTVSDKLDNIINPEVNRLFSCLQQKVCDGCEKKQTCWHKSFESTARDILIVAGIEKRSGGKSALSSLCKRYEQLCSAISSCYPTYTRAMEAKNRAGEMRRLLTDQFISLGDFISDLSVTVAQERNRDKAKSTYLKTALGDSGIHCDCLSYFSSSGRVHIEVSFIELPPESEFKKIRPILEFVTGRRFNNAIVTVKELSTIVSFNEKPAYKVSVGYSQHPVRSGILCGDFVCSFNSAQGYPTAIISDGMGTGARAAVDSSMTASLMEKLISGGFSFSSALKLVNTALIMKSTDESISTVDSVQINPFNGTAEFYKAGAAISFLRQKGEVSIIEKESLPLGIIRDISLAREKKQTEKGDIILLVSDGVTAGDCGWINDELLAWTTNNMNDLAGHISSLARLRTPKNTRDDITVVALKVESNKE